MLTPDNASPDREPSTVGLDRALGSAYRFLNDRERTLAEVRAQLTRAGTAPAAVDRAIAMLVEQGYLDDARFARLFVQDKRELEGWGGDRIRQALLSRGVGAELVDDALSASDAHAELDRALAVLCRRFPSLSGERRERDRALGVLLRKGYDVDLALDAIAIHSNT